jgi:hypothetical protein
VNRLACQQLGRPSGVPDKRLAVQQASIMIPQRLGWPAVWKTIELLGHRAGSKAGRQAVCRLSGCRARTRQSSRLAGEQTVRQAVWKARNEVSQQACWLAGRQACTLAVQKPGIAAEWQASRLEVQQAGRPVCRQTCMPAGHQNVRPADQEAGSLAGQQPSRPAVMHACSQVGLHPAGSH